METEKTEALAPKIMWLMMDHVGGEGRLWGRLSVPCVYYLSNHYVPRYVTILPY